MTAAKKTATGTATDHADNADNAGDIGSDSRAVATTTGSALQSDQGNTTIADTVVEKIAGVSAREVPGVHNLGRGSARALGAVRERIGAKASLAQGVRVEVGLKQAAVDLELVVEYGVDLTDLAEAVRANVIANIERMTALEVTEVNLAINDIYIPGDDSDSEDGPRSGSRVE